MRGDTLIWVVPDSVRGTQTFQVVARDTLGNSGPGIYAVFVWYQPPAPRLGFTGTYAKEDTVKLVAGRPDSIVVELLGVDPRDRSLIRVTWDSTGAVDYVEVDTVGGAEPPAIRIRFAPADADTAGPQSLFMDYDGSQGTLAFF